MLLQIVSFALSVFLCTATSSLVSDRYADGDWRKTLDVCWTDPSCNRVMTIVHGGDWNLTLPYDSKPAFIKAYELGADAVKGDFRVSKDNIGMIMHSSPIEIYESFDCAKKKVEEHTAEENAACHMIYTNYTFQPLPDMLKWADDRINFMFCVKESTDIPRAITTLIENNATHRAFLEIHAGDMQNVVETAMEGWEDVYYIIEIYNMDDFNSMMSSAANVLKRTFLFEFHDWSSWDSTQLSECLAAARTAGVRTVGVTRSSAPGATVRDHMQIFEAGFDVVYTYNLGNAVTARRATNIQRDISPP